MKSKKGLLVLIAIAFGALFIAFTNNSNNEDGIASLEQRKKLLTAIGTLLESQHYSPKQINDAFSKKVFKKSIEELDGEKNILLKADIDALKKYENSIDDEIHGGDIVFSPTLSAIYDKRFKEVEKLYKDNLAKPFDFTIDETFITDEEKLDYPVDEKERNERWRKKMKYLTLERYVDLLDQREKLLNKDSAKTDTQLEQEARDKVLKIMNRTFERIKSTFTEEKRFNAFINVIANVMDPHTDYFPPVEKRAFDEQMSGRFYGIGAQLQEQDGVIKIASLVAGYPAWRSGDIEANDIIVKVAQGKEEPVDITGYDVTDAVKLIRGNKGTEVRLTIKKQNGTLKVVALMRDEIVQDESYVRSAIINEGAKKIGYIFLPDFYADFERADGARCSEDVAKEIIKLKKEQIDGIVLDLRNNGGGSLYEVVQMVGLFIKSGPVVQVKDKDGKVTVLSDNDPTVLYEGPLAVMVNGFSASASEIFAAAIQDYKRGIIIGSNSSTYGKGTVQRNVALGKPIDFASGRTEYGAVKLTFQKFYRINGGSTQLKGVTPDVFIPDSYEFLKFREKDNPASLPWDEINKANYETNQNDNALQSSIISGNNSIAVNSNLSIIKSNGAWLAQNNLKPVELNIAKYRAHQKLVKTTVEQINTLSKLNGEMNIGVTTADNAKYFSNADKSKGERYQAWLKLLKTDLYIDATKNILLNYLKENEIASTKK